MEKISVQQFHEITKDTIFLKGNHLKPKVLFKTSTQEIIKLIRKSKKFYSLSHIWSYAKRFESGSKRINALGIPALKWKYSYYYPTGKCHVVIYDFLEGIDLHSLTQAKTPVHCSKVLELIQRLHQAGVYFRDFHLGNVLLRENQQLALIDVASMSFQKSSLTPKQRARNFTHWFNRNEDQTYFKYFNPAVIIQTYLNFSDLTPHQRDKFCSYFNLYRI